MLQKKKKKSQDKQKNPTRQKVPKQSRMQQKATKSHKKPWRPFVRSGSSACFAEVVTLAAAFLSCDHSWVSRSVMLLLTPSGNTSVGFVFLSVVWNLQTAQSGLGVTINQDQDHTKYCRRSLDQRMGERKGNGGAPFLVAGVGSPQPSATCDPHQEPWC